MNMLLWHLLCSVAANVVALSYSVIREIVHAARDATWYMNGTKATILKSREDGGYERCVQILGIMGRYKTDDIAFANFLTDFILSHERFEESSYLLRSEISLYCITPREFVFVQCRDGDTAWDVKDFPFSRHGQHQKAVKVLLLPIHAAHRLAAHLSNRPQRQLIFILNTGRCGSTLVCQTFQDTDRCVAYSEPAVFNDLLREYFNPDDTDPEANKIIKAAVTLLCTPSASKGATALLDTHALKLQPMAIPMVGILTKLFPNSPCVFLYRDIKATCLSYSTINPIPAGVQMILCYMVSHRRYCNLLVSHGLWSPQIFPPPYVPPMGYVGHMAIIPVLANRCYMDLCNKKTLNLCAVRYEDLVRAPFDAFSRIFEFCRLPQSCVQLALRDIHRDSQSNSALSIARRQKPAKSRLSAQEMSAIGSIGKMYGVANILDEMFTVAGTLDI